MAKAATWNRESQIDSMKPYAATEQTRGDDDDDDYDDDDDDDLIYVRLC